MWKRTNNAGSLQNGTDQVFYHILVDVADWPMDMDIMGDEPDAPVAYVAEELLDKITLTDFDSDEPIVNTPFQHPYSYLMFLGTNGRRREHDPVSGSCGSGYDVERTDDPVCWSDRRSTSDDVFEDRTSSRHWMARGDMLDELRPICTIRHRRGIGPERNRAAGIDSIPGIDMRSLSDGLSDESRACMTE